MYCCKCGTRNPDDATFCNKVCRVAVRGSGRRREDVSRGKGRDQQGHKSAVGEMESG
jgi:hypothetical protein